MPTFDASSLIYAWDNYPLELFPPLWDWMADQIQAEEFTVCQVAFEEVGHKSPECADWLRDAEIKRIAVNAEIVEEAYRIKGLLGIENDAYGPRGVDENDLLIIATAKTEGVELISNEAKQVTPPTLTANRKIPSVCSMSEVRVRCISFIQLIRTSGTVFRE